METIIILPKDVTVTWLPETKQIQIEINKETMIEKETGNLFMEKLYDELNGLITCNEINPTTDTWLIEDGEIYILTPKNIAELKESGVTIIAYQGTLKENVDLTLESDRNFIMWYYSADTIEEAVMIMNEKNK
jgi:hypothetical protein